MKWERKASHIQSAGTAGRTLVDRNTLAGWIMEFSQSKRAH